MKKDFDDETLRAIIEEYYNLHGIYEPTIGMIQAYISERFPEQRAPCKSTIGKIVKNDFHLRYKKLNTANFKYLDPTYNEKRLWTSRLLA
jgi:hypothetical protein